MTAATKTRTPVAAATPAVKQRPEGTRTEVEFMEKAVKLIQYGDTYERTKAQFQAAVINNPAYAIEDMTERMLNAQAMHEQTSLLLGYFTDDAQPLAERMTVIAKEARRNVKRIIDKSLYFSHSTSPIANLRAEAERTAMAKMVEVYENLDELYQEYTAQA